MFNTISVHYLEFAPSSLPQLGDVEILFHAPETTKGGESAIDSSQSIVRALGELGLEISLSRLNSVTIEWINVCHKEPITAFKMEKIMVDEIW